MVEIKKGTEGVVNKITTEKGKVKAEVIKKVKPKKEKTKAEIDNEIKTLLDLHSRFEGDQVSGKARQLRKKLRRLGYYLSKHQIKVKKVEKVEKKK